MKHRIGIMSILLILSGTVMLRAQDLGKVQAQIEAKIQAQQAASKPSEPSLKLNPLEMLRNFEPPANEEYRLGKGDEIVVDFAGRPEMLAKIVIGPDGNI